MSIVRLGAVEYLNARPLVYGLDRRPDRFALRFDLPARCADLLHGGDVDLGLIPSIEYLRGDGYLAVPGVAIGSDGPVDSVAVFANTPLSRVRTLALDTSSRTSVALLRVLCARHFGIDPELRPMVPDPGRMLAKCDAALIIGDVALMFDHVAAGVEKTDLGTAWAAFTGLPFVYAFWVGREGAITRPDVDLLVQAGRAGVDQADDVARSYFGTMPEWVDAGARYLRGRVKYGFGERQRAGLTRFYREAAALGLVPAFAEPRFY